MRDFLLPHSGPKEEPQKQPLLWRGGVHHRLQFVTGVGTRLGVGLPGPVLGLEQAGDGNDGILLGPCGYAHQFVERRYRSLTRVEQVVPVSNQIGPLDFLDVNLLAELGKLLEFGSLAIDRFLGTAIQRNAQPS